jgi:hypothetical protein
MRVWIIFKRDSTDFAQGAEVTDSNVVMSVWTNQVQAEREQQRLQRLHPDCHIWSHTECTRGKREDS